MSDFQNRISKILNSGLRNISTLIRAGPKLYEHSAKIPIRMPGIFTLSSFSAFKSRESLGYILVGENSSGDNSSSET